MSSNEISDNLGPAPQFDIEEPAPKSDSISNSMYSGWRGHNEQTHILQGDNEGSPIISIGSKSNIYIDAANKIQITNNYSYTNVKTTYKQYLQKTTESATGYKQVKVGGNSKYNVNTTHSEEVAGSHLLNVGGLQHSIIGGGQQVDIGGDYTVEILAGDIVTIVNGDRKAVIDGKASFITNATKDELWFGGVLKTKASSELSLVYSNKLNASLSFEKSITVGASAKVEVGASYEIVLAGGTDYVVGLSYEKTVGLKVTFAPLTFARTGISMAATKISNSIAAALAKRKKTLSVTNATTEKVG